MIKKFLLGLTLLFVLSTAASASDYYVLGEESMLADHYNNLPFLKDSYLDGIGGINQGPYVILGNISIVAWQPVNITIDKKPYDGVPEYTKNLATGEVWTIDDPTIGGAFIHANGTISVVRLAYKVGTEGTHDLPGTYATVALNLLPVNVWDTNYKVTFGNVSNYSVHLIVQAKEDNTQVTVTGFAPVILNRGDEAGYHNVALGLDITANKSVEAALIMGANGTHYSLSEQPNNNSPYFDKRWDSRSYILKPSLLRGDDYLVPVPSFDTMYSNETTSGANASDWPNRTATKVTTRLYIFAFNNTNITITDGTGYNSGNIFIPAGNLYSLYAMPRTAGLYMNDTDPNFLLGNATRITGDDMFVVSGMADDNYVDFDWAFQPISANVLSNHYVIPFAPANPLYVTPTRDGTVFHIDYNNDGTIDETFTLDTLKLRMIYPNATLHNHNLTGVNITADFPFALQWGQDNNENTPGERHSPDKDYGYTLFPLEDFEPGTVDGYVYQDPNCNCTYDNEPGVDNVTVNLVNITGNVVNTTKTDANGYYLFTNVTPEDYFVNYSSGDLPTYLTPKCDDDTGKSGTTLFDKITSNNFNVPAGGTHRHNFAVKATPSIILDKLVNGVNQVNANHGDTVTFTLNITNTGLINLTNLSVTDFLPVGLTYADTASPTEDAITGQVIQWWGYNGTGAGSLAPYEPLAPGGSFVITFNATVDSNAAGLYRNLGNVTARNSTWGNVSYEDDAFVLVKSTKVPALNLEGMVLLVGTLSIIAISRIRKKR